MNKRDCSRFPIFYLIIMLLLILLPTSITKATSLTIPKKVVSIVCDDSGSMDGEDWEKTNYALQAFVALLNDTDEAYITYMLTPGSYNKINLQNRQSEIDQIREEEYPSAGTPLESVYTAMDALRNTAPTSPSDEYWLVVLTDGLNPDEFDGDTEFQQSLDKFAKETINGLPVQIIFLGIGSAADSVTGNNSNLMAMNAGNDIVGSLKEIAAIVTGKQIIDAQTNDKRVYQITSKLPLYSLVAFSQNSNAHITDTGGYKIEQEYSVATFPSSGFNCTGNVTLISNDSSVMPAGTYTITFSEPVQDVVFLSQPAVQLDIKVFRENQEIDPSDLRPNEVVDVKIVAVNPEDGSEISDQDMPSGTQLGIDYVVDNNTISSASDKSTQIEIKSGENEIVGFIDFPGLIPAKEFISFHVDEYIPSPELQLIITSGGTTVYDNINGIDLTSNLKENDSIEITLIPYDSLTRDDLSNYFSNEQWNIQYQIDGNTYLEDDTNTLIVDSLDFGNISILGDFTGDGYNAKLQTDFSVGKAGVYGIETDTPQEYKRGKLKSDSYPDNVRTNCYITYDLDDNNDGIGDGNIRRLDGTELKGRTIIPGDTSVDKPEDIKFYEYTGLFDVKFNIIENANGSIEIYPTQNWVIRNLCPYLIKVGTYKVNLDIAKRGRSYGINQDAYLIVRGNLSDWIPFIIEIIILLLFIYFFLILFKKKKFNTSLKIEIQVYEKMGEEGIKNNSKGQKITLKRYGDNPLSLAPAKQVCPMIGVNLFADDNGNPCFSLYKTSGIWGKKSMNPKQFDHSKAELEREVAERKKKAAKLKEAKMKLDQVHIITARPTYFYKGMNIYEIKMVRK